MDNPDLYKFSMTWIVAHNILAGTAWTPELPALGAAAFLESIDECYVHTLTGFSKQLFSLLSDINDLAILQSKEMGLFQDKRLPVAPASPYRQRRDNIERALHRVPLHETKSTISIPQDLDISEVKRLTILMYLYARIDESSPSEPHMMRLTKTILNLIPRISLRTNTLLWPLFIVGVFGVRPESDGDRIIVLKTLDALQKTRQLGCVKKARDLIEHVWTIRDLSPAEAAKGRSILDGRHRKISLA